MPTPASLVTYIGQVKSLLGLSDWRVDVDPEPCSQQYDAYVTVVPGHKWAIIELGPTFADKPADEQRHTIVHELLHLHFDEVRGVLKRNLPDDPMHRVIMNEHLNFIEHGVEAVASAVHVLLPEVPDGTALSGTAQRAS